MSSFLDRLDEVDRLLDEAFELPPAERRRFLDDVCGADAELRGHAERLLTLADAHDAVLEDGAAALAVPLVEEFEAAVSLVGQRIGPYRVVREVGAGGMGTVYLGERADGAFDQRVAIKVVRRGLALGEVLRRFRRERQVLASLQHPHIAALYDGGLTPDGLPYLVMEYVEGVSITEYCDRHRLPPRARLRLFRTVCRAVQHAHQNLVVHRDLKPSNILVTEDGTVKLLDFGIAKLLHPTEAGALDEALGMAPSPTAPLTQTGMQMMTPEYASPEQIRGETVTTASDVYALGVLLYELLVGTRPYRLPSRLRHEAARVILEEEPTKPSTALIHVRADGTSPRAVSAARGVTVEGLQRQIRGDLDNITLKALAKEPDRRYGTAEGLAADLGRYLDGLPVEARPATVGYRLGKFVRRHRAAVLATLATAMLVTGLVGFYTLRLAAERDRATREADKATQIQDFVLGLFDAADPDRRDDATARDLLAEGRARIDDELDGQPEVQAEMRVVMALLYSKLGDYDQADSLLTAALSTRRAAFGEAHPLVAETLYELGVVRRYQGRYAEADRLHRQALDQRRALLPDGDPALAESTNELGLVAWQQGDYATAERMHRETLARRRALFGDASLEVSTSLNNLGIALIYQSRNEEALPLLEEALAVRRALFGTEHSRVATVIDNIALAYDNLDRYEESEPRRREALALRRAIFGEEHPSVASSLINLGATLKNRGRLDEAEPLLRESWAMRRRLLGDDHPLTLTSQRYVADLLGRNGRSAEAEALLRDALARLRARLGPEHPEVALTLQDLGQTLYEQGRLDEAEAVLYEALVMNRRLLGEDHPRTAAVREQLDQVRLRPSSP